MLFSTVIAEGMNDFLQMFFRASGVRYRLPDGSSMKEWCRGREGSSVMRVAFHITERLYSSVRGSWVVLVIFTGLLYSVGEFCFGGGSEEVEPG